MPRSCSLAGRAYINARSLALSVSVRVIDQIAYSFWVKLLQCSYQPNYAQNRHEMYIQSPYDTTYFANYENIATFAKSLPPQHTPEPNYVYTYPPPSLSINLHDCNIIK